MGITLSQHYFAHLVCLQLTILAIRQLLILVNFLSLNWFQVAKVFAEIEFSGFDCIGVDAVHFFFAEKS